MLCWLRWSRKPKIENSDRRLTVLVEGRFAVPAGCAAARDLSVQARARAGRGLRHATARASTRRSTLASPRLWKAQFPEIAEKPA